MARTEHQSAAGRVLSFIVYGLGVGLFAHLMLSSGLRWDQLRDAGWQIVAWSTSLYLVVMLIDAWAWRIAAEQEHGFLRLLFLRIAGESLTNSLPGGVVFGETYKAAKLRQWDGTPLSTSAPRLLLIKFGLGYSQALFVLVGLVLAYPLLESQSTATLGIPHLHWIVLAAIVAMCVLMAVPAYLLVRGNSFAGAADILAALPSVRLRDRINRLRPSIAMLDRGCAEIAQAKARAATTLLLLVLRWMATVPETYLLLSVLGAEATWTQAFVIEALGSVFRLVFFLVPSGVGGQDASFLALLRLYGLPSAFGGAFIVLKRFREVLWIGFGYFLLAIERATAGALFGVAVRAAPERTGLTKY